MTSPRVLVVAEEGAQVSVVETAAGTTDASYLTNAVTEVVVGEDQQHLGLDDGHSARQHAGIVAALGLQRATPPLAVDGALGLANRRGRLEEHTADDRLAVGDAPLDAARAVGPRAPPRGAAPGR